MRAPGAKSKRETTLPEICARLVSWARIEVHGSGAVVAVFDTDTVSLGTFGATAVSCLQELRTGLPLRTLAPESGSAGKEIDLLVRRLAAQGLLEYRVGRPGAAANDLIVIEPQVRGYLPRTPQLNDADTLVLSRFAYLRRRGDEMVLESPRAGALFRVCDPALAGLVAMLSTPRQIGDLRRQDGFPGLDFLALLLDCQIVFKVEAGESNLRLIEGDQSLALWDFHDFLFHTRSTEGRHINPLGGVYPHSGVIPPMPALRPPWPGEKIDLPRSPAPSPEAMPPITRILRERHSTRSFDDRHPITLAELSRFLDGCARVLPRPAGGIDFEDAGETFRPYPSAGASWELELYLSVNNCEGLPQGFYHYDAAAHALAPIEAPAKEVKALLTGAASAMGVAAAPQILITIAARFGRVSWKYSSIAYSLILKDAGVLTQTLYLMVAEMGLGGCAIGISNIDQFEKLTGIGCHIEGPVGQFALGRRAAPAARG